MLHGSISFMAMASISSSIGSSTSYMLTAVHGIISSMHMPSISSMPLRNLSELAWA